MSHEITFNLTVVNEGDSTDAFDFEFEGDDQTATYKKWVTLPSSIMLDPGGSQEVEFRIEVHPYMDDNDAVADGSLKDVVIKVYSKGARDNDQEIEGVTTDNYTCGIDIERYRYATFTNIDPDHVVLYTYEQAEISVTLRNEGNGDETYYLDISPYFIWCGFKTSSVQVAPGSSVLLTIMVFPYENTEPGTRNFYFHAQTSGGYMTDSYSFNVTINETYEMKFFGQQTRSTDPGKTVTMQISVRNYGNVDTPFILHDPLVPEGWGFTWQDGNSATARAGQSTSLPVGIEVPAHAEPGQYRFNITGEYEGEGGNISEIPGAYPVTVNVNELSRVRVDANETENRAEPGESVMYVLQIHNLGNVDDTYNLTIEAPPGIGDGSPWARTAANSVSVMKGHTSPVEIRVDVPAFTPDDHDAVAGRYGIRIVMRSQNETGVHDEIVFELEVGSIQAVASWSDVPGVSRVLREGNVTVVTCTIIIWNLGNDHDEILVHVPPDELTGGKRDWEVRIGDQPSQTVGLDPLARQSLDLVILIDETTAPGNYTLTVRSGSLADPSAFDDTTFFINLTKTPYSIIRSISPNPSVLGEPVRFTGDASDYGEIVRYIWHSNLDGELYNGSGSDFIASLLSPGNHTITLTVLDTNGLWSTPVSAVLLVHQRPVAAIEGISPSPSVSGEPVRFTGNASDHGEIVGYIWHSNINGELYNGSGRDFIASSLSLGDHTITLTVLDLNGTWSTPVSAVLLVHQRPVATIVSISPSPAKTGDVIQLVGHGSDDGMVLRYVWMMNGTEISNSTESDYTLLDPPAGTFTISYRVQDEHGAWSEEVSQELEVMADTDGKGDKGFIPGFDAVTLVLSLALVGRIKRRKGVRSPPGP